MGNNYKLILSALGTVGFLFVFANVQANPVRQYIEIDRADLKLLIGEKYITNRVMDVGLVMVQKE